LQKTLKKILKVTMLGNNKLVDVGLKVVSPICDIFCTKNSII